MKTIRKPETAKTIWSSAQAYTLAVMCLLLGLAVGFLVRGSAAAPVAGTIVPAAPQQTSLPQMPGMGGMPVPSNNDLVEKALTPKLEAVKRNPKDVATLTDIGNTYYDAKMYREAIRFYGDALKVAPGNVNVRTDMGTAYWYLGDADHAVAEFEKSLAHEPTHAQTLFNLGIVKWQGHKDGRGAIAAWQKLLQSNPNYPERQNVEQLIEQARRG